MTDKPARGSYADFGLARSWRQLSHALRRDVSTEARTLAERILRDRRRIEDCIEKPLAGLDLVEIGAGQVMSRARYLGLENSVTAIDMDVIPRGIRLRDYARMWRDNGAGRVIKTLGRKLLGVDAKLDRALRRELGVGRWRDPAFLRGDICGDGPPAASCDGVVSWSVFEHLPDPRRALANVLRALRPGGFFHISLHLFTSHNGHHDIRAFTGRESEVPLWGHLRPEQRHLVEPSSWLNEWRLGQWRELFSELAPGTAEFRESYGAERVYDPGPFRDELADYADEELFTVDLIFLGRKA